MSLMKIYMLTLLAFKNVTGKLFFSSYITFILEKLTIFFY